MNRFVSKPDTKFHIPVATATKATIKRTFIADLLSDREIKRVDKVQLSSTVILCQNKETIHY